METDQLMVAPRATKCGCHVFCYPCLLQYLDYEKERAWKKCPTCKDPIYKKDIRRATVLHKGGDEKLEKIPSSFASPGQTIEFRLMVRNKSNINVKYKSPDSMTIFESQLPSVNQAEYERSRIRMCDEAYLRKALADDLKAL